MLSRLLFSAFRSAWKRFLLILPPAPATPPDPPSAPALYPSDPLPEPSAPPLWTPQSTPRLDLRGKPFGSSTRNPASLRRRTRFKQELFRVFRRRRRLRSLFSGTLRNDFVRGQRWSNQTHEARVYSHDGPMCLVSRECRRRTNRVSSASSYLPFLNLAVRASASLRPLRRTCPTGTLLPPIYRLPSCDWFSCWVYTDSPPVIGSRAGYIQGLAVWLACVARTRRGSFEQRVLTPLF